MSLFLPYYFSFILYSIHSSYLLYFLPSFLSSLQPFDLPSSLISFLSSFLPSLLTHSLLIFPPSFLPPFMSVSCVQPENTHLTIPKYSSYLPFSSEVLMRKDNQSALCLIAYKDDLSSDGIFLRKLFDLYSSLSIRKTVGKYVWIVFELCDIKY